MTLSPTPQPGSEPRTFEERLQARMEAIEASPAAAPPRWPTAVGPGLPDEVSPKEPADDVSLPRQIQMLRKDLQRALEGIDERLEEAAARILRAELRATIADARTGDVLEALATLERSFRVTPPVTLAEGTLRFRSTVDQLKARLNTSS